MSKIGDDFVKDRGINRFKLEEESEKSPGLVHLYADLLADAKDALNKQKERVSFTKGQRDLFWRRNCPADLKPVEGSYASLLASDEILQAEIKKELEAQAEVNALEAVMRSLDHRKSELNNLTKLWLGGYYTRGGESAAGTPESTPRDHEHMRDAMLHDQTQEEDF